MPRQPGGGNVATVETWTGRETRRLRQAMRLTVRAFAEDLGVSVRTVSKWEKAGAGVVPRPELQAALDTLFQRANQEDRDRLTASDVGPETLLALELAVDELASSYQGARPEDLLLRTRGYLSYVGRLLDARMALSERRRLLVVGGWLSLLAATCDIDLGRRPTAAVRLRTAVRLAQEAGHPEIVAWTLETQAWERLTEGDFRAAVGLSQEAQDVAPRSTSAFIQATAQEGRAWARLGAGAETRDALARVERLVAPLPVPTCPEHHYHYDPGKSDTYVATTLAWVGDPAAEDYARGVLNRLEATASGLPRPRRAASARLDLALALLASDQPDEAAHQARTAIESGRLVPSNYWRAAEIVRAVKLAGAPEAVELFEAYQELDGA